MYLMKDTFFRFCLKIILLAQRGPCLYAFTHSPRLPNAGLSMILACFEHGTCDTKRANRTNFLCFSRQLIA